MVNFNVSAFNLFPLFMNLRRPQDKKANFCLPLTNNVAEEGNARFSSSRLDYHKIMDANIF
jgi:hypothetical protein